MTIANSQRRRYLAKADLTPEYLSGLIPENQGAPNHREVLEFVGLRQHSYNDQMPSGSIVRRHRVETRDQRAHIVGFSDRSIDIGKEQFTQQLLEPYHIKDKVMHGPDAPGWEIGSDDMPVLEESQVTSDVMRLNEARLNLLVEAFLAMCNDRQFRYISGSSEDASDLVITIPYDQDIGLLPDAASYDESGGDFNTPSTVKVLYEIRQMKAAYRKKYGAPPNLIFVNPTTAGVLLNLDKISAIYTPVQSSDPNTVAQSYEAFTYDGILFVTWHNEYLAADGSGGSQYIPAVDDGYGIVTRTTATVDGGPPMRWSRAETKLNEKDASKPHFSALIEGSDPKKIGPKMYDNGIPEPAEKNLIQKVKFYTPS